jgi:hypothetical protein
MAAPDKLQASRFERKYLIREDVALGIREFVQSYLELDEHSAGMSNFSYPVHSLYLDSDDLKLYWHTINGNKNRFKLRVRYYNDRSDAPAFFEVKRRINHCILKQRAAVRREAVDQILAGQMPAAAELISRDGKSETALCRFIELMQQINAKPKAHVAYSREAYVPHDDNSARVTLDRRVRIEPEFTTRLGTQMNHPSLVWPHVIVLELKFTNRFPLWFAELVRIFQLQQSGAAKYADGVFQLGEDCFNPPWREQLRPACAEEEVPWSESARPQSATVVGGAPGAPHALPA